MLETIKLGAQAFLFLAAALVIDMWALSGTFSGVLAFLAIVLAALIVLLIWIVGFSCRRDRVRLASVFGGSVALLLVLVTAFVFLQGCVLLLMAGRAYEAGVRNMRVELELVIAGFVAFASAISIAMSIRTMAQKLISPVMGLAVTPEMQPALWAFANSIAEKVGATSPKQIIVGLEPTFYATAADIMLTSVERRPAQDEFVVHRDHLSGQTMFLSLPLLRLLSKGELTAVIGHELGHFKGLDTAYTLEFVPVYRGVTHALDVTASVSGDSLWGRVITSPATTILRFYLSEFTNTEREIGRERELEADKSGALASSPEDLVGALVKVGAFAPIWPSLCRHAAELVKERKMLTNMSMAFADHASHVRETVEPAELKKVVLASRQTHPTDTHPPLEARARAIGIETFDFEKMTKLEGEPASALIADAEAVEQSLSALLQKYIAMSNEPKSMGEAISRPEESPD